VARLLVNITHGPEDPFRAALGFLLAATASEEGHEVTIFLAGDATQLIRDAVIESHCVGAPNDGDVALTARWYRRALGSGVRWP